MKIDRKSPSPTVPNFNPHRHVLADGQTVALRQVDQDDKDELAEAFEKLSPESRYSRFFSPRRFLSERDLERLTDVDGYRHFAVGAELDGTPVAIAHFFRDKDEPSAAEIAITVLDDYQGLGIGELLFRELIHVATERGIEDFKAEVLADNRHMRRLVKKIQPAAESRTLRGVTEYRIPLKDTTTLHGDPTQ